MQTELSQFKAIIGLDWADKKHDVCVQATASGQRKTYQIQHKAEKIDAWARALYRRYGGPIAVALELSKGPIVSALQKYDFFVIFPIDPTTLANYRKTFTPSGAKDDPTDAELALDLLLCHPDHFQSLKPQSVEMRALMTLVEQRRRLMNDRVRITNRLRNALKQYYPQALEWFDRIDTPLFCDFIKRWPSLAQARRARKATLEKFFHEHHMNRKALLEQRVTAIKSAVALTTDDAVIVPFRLQALTLVAQLEVALESIRIYDDEIAALAPQHPDYDLFRALPGAGPLLAPRLLVAFGEQRERFTSAAELQKYAGIAAGHQAQRPVDLDPLAMAVPDVLATDLRRVVGTDHQQVVLGGLVLLSAASKRLLVPGGCQSTGVQVDPHPVSMLGNPNALRRSQVS